MSEKLVKIVGECEINALFVKTEGFPAKSFRVSALLCSSSQTHSPPPLPSRRPASGEKSPGESLALFPFLSPSFLSSPPPPLSLRNASFPRTFRLLLLLLQRPLLFSLLLLRAEKNPGGISEWRKGRKEGGEGGHR